jgi:hypothetical protein
VFIKSSLYSQHFFGQFKGRSQSPAIMQLIHHLVLVAATCNFALTAPFSVPASLLPQTVSSCRSSLSTSTYPSALHLNDTYGPCISGATLQDQAPCLQHLPGAVNAPDLLEGMQHGRQIPSGKVSCCKYTPHMVPSVRHAGLPPHTGQPLPIWPITTLHAASAHPLVARAIHHLFGHIAAHAGVANTHNMPTLLPYQCCYCSSSSTCPGPPVANTGSMEVRLLPKVHPHAQTAMASV